MGVTSPESLLNTVWFNNAIHLGLRGQQEHYNLCWGDISLQKNSDGVEYLQHYERQTKTRTGADARDTRKILGKIFSVPHLKENNPIEVYKKYASLRPKGFFQNQMTLSTMRLAHFHCLINEAKFGISNRN